MENTPHHTFNGTDCVKLVSPHMCVCRQVRFSWLFFAGAVPVFLSFFIATLLCHYNNWDPVLVGLRRVYAFICRKHRIQRYETINIYHQRVFLLLRPPLVSHSA